MINFSKLIQTFSTKQTVICEFTQQGRMATVTLNRPQQYNSVNVDMFGELEEHFDDMTRYNTQVVILRGTDGNLSAGGDVKSVYLAKHSPSPEYPTDVQQRLFYHGYAKAYQWATSKPILIPYFEGITIGGVVGWTAYSQFRVATEKTIMAIPELRIGYFIDCGGAHWIHKRKNSIGQFLAYTGHRMRAADNVHSGMADYFVKSEEIENMHQELKNISVTANRKSNITQIKQVVDKYHETNLPTYSLKDHQKSIDEWFSSKTIEDLFEKLLLSQTEFSQEVFRMMKEQNPLSLVLMAEYLKRSKRLTLKEVFQFDYHLSQKFMQRTDFFEGVKSVLVDRGHKPQWQFTNTRQVSEEDVNEYFQNMKPKLPL